MNRTALNLLIAAVMVVGVGGLVVLQKQATPVGTSDSAISTAMTLAGVAMHNTRDDCWTVINGAVYDLTSWIPEHPGGEEAIIRLCGTDGSALFNGKHGGAAKQAAILAGFKVGEVGVAAPSADDN